MIYTETIKLKIDSQKYVDITTKVEDVVNKSKVKDGMCIVFSIGSTSGVILNENEPMLIKDIQNALEVVSDPDKIYNHSENAFSHIRSSVAGNNQIIPIEDGQLVRGTWQDILLFNFDVRERQREVIIKVMGE
jgi:secondary thiamine-phosphate synthase enzyme